jgi:pimeloyl-ACP methyl ester carboxylesterase
MKKLLLAFIVLGTALTPLAHAAVKSVVLVHGAFSDGSGWKPVAGLLEHDGYTVYIVQEPETSFEADVAATRIVLDRSGPCVLVGHSWGGMIITEAGTHASVRSLVYITAFQPEVGESAGALQTKTPPAVKSIGPVGEGFVAMNPQAFHQDFAADLPKSVAHFMSISQVPIAAASFAATVTATAWSQKRSYAVVSTQDRMINPELERFMSARAKSETIELTGSHAIFLSHPKEVAALIEKAAMAAE